MSGFKCTFRIVGSETFFAQSIGSTKWISLEGKGIFCWLLLPATGIFHIWHFDFGVTLVSFRANRRRRCLPSFATRAEGIGRGRRCGVSPPTPSVMRRTLNTDFPYLWIEFWKAVPAS